MAEQPNDHLSKLENDTLDLYKDHPQYLQSPLYQVFEKYHEEASPAVPAQVGRLILRPWCGNKFLQTLAFELTLTPSDREFLRQLGVRS
jgi:hypothetical protein